MLCAIFSYSLIRISKTINLFAVLTRSISKTAQLNYKQQLYV